ncbi:MAG: hypothetical protein HUK21_03350 [Fibrobacteraceae bacterium]|nr:hypothetical protein [Fibrobacteraceae bacterium]
MKKKLFILQFLSVLFLTVPLWSEENQGTAAYVELLSGVKQKAQFLGVVNDTVQLGGYIKNEFTIVKIARNQFKSILDENGKDLLATDSLPTAIEQAPQSSDTIPTDSLTSTDSLTQEIAPAKTPEEYPDFRGKNIFITYEHRAIDQPLAQHLNVLTAKLLMESDVALQVYSKTDFAPCTDEKCIKDTLNKMGASSAFFGSIYPARYQDSLTVQLKAVKWGSTVPILTSAKMNISAKTALTDIFKKNHFNNMIQTVLGKAVAPKDTKGYIHVETDPEGATLSLPLGSPICKTPCTFATTDTGRVVINAYWNVEEHLWGAQSIVRPLLGDTSKVSLKLKRISPEIKITTNPPDVEIFPGSGKITKSSKSLGSTPKKFKASEPGLSYVRLRKAGYRDTLVSFYVAPINETELNINMTQLESFDEFEAQKQWIHERKMYNAGKALMGASVAPIVVGLVFTYLATQDYNDAESVKDDLQKPGTAEGANYNKLVKKNHDLVDKGDNKMILGGSLIGGGILLFGIGFVLTF